MQNLLQAVRSRGRTILTGLIGMIGLTTASLHAFPPTPYHRVMGMVRNEMGDPLNMTNAVVLMETQTGTQVKTRVVPNLGPGRNYVLNVPMDAGVTSDNYKVGAVRAAAPFRMKVQIGGVTYLPLETAINTAALGKPAKTTTMDLTLGEDVDGDGLPDAWERALLAMMGMDGTIRDIRPNDDTDGDGISNLKEYLAGTFAFDPADGFKLDVVGKVEDRMVLEFLAIPGRRYALQGSADMQVWKPVGFRLEADPSNATPRGEYVATRTQLVRVEIVSDGSNPTSFFKATVQ